MELMSARTLEGECQLVGVSPAILALGQEIEGLARSNTKVLITGESGVGKEVVARSIHANGPRSARPFAAVNCAGIPETLLESELFGHVRGSFTGAYRDKAGHFEMADRGTIFLDEIGEMTLRMQGILLRVLETGEIQKVGADRLGTSVDVRVLASTHRNLRAMVSDGTFREDLLYRINVIHLKIAPLRERREDIPLLAQHFLDRFASRGDRIVRSISQPAMDLLVQYEWPGNVRELRNVMERISVTGRTEMAEVEDLPLEIRRPAFHHAGPRRERRKTVADELFKRLIENRESFWTAVYPLYMDREISRSTVRDLVRKGLEEARGNYRGVARLFNMEAREYKRFLNFLRKHDCQLPYKEYR
jgi:two-component system, NtrC family, response regulator AtoC